MPAFSQGRNYLREGNYAKAYLLLLRYSTLYLGHVAKHPDAKSAEGRSLLKPVKERTPFVFDQLETIKPYIIDAYSEWEKITAEEIRQQTVSQTGQSSHDNHVRRDAALSWNSQVQAKILDAGDHQDLAVDLAAKELQRRDAARRASRHGGLSADEERQRRAAGIWDGWDRGSRGPGAAEDDELRRHMEATRRRLDQVDDSGHARRSPSEDVPVSVNYHYPAVSKSVPIRYDSGAARPTNGNASGQPARPPKENLPRPPPRYDPLPPLPPKKEPKHDVAYQPPSGTPGEQEVGPALPPKTFEASPKKERYTFKPAAYLENGEPVRPVFLPLNLQKDFVRLAAENTRRGVEMCGLLCGTSVNNALFITRLLIPEQICTPDTCETTNEAGTFDYMDKEDLIQLGWIHTHPTQTCFMSSRDLHTQAGYQIMMPESIAIVCAPTHEPS